MRTATTGRDAEIAVAGYLKKSGFKILDRNWRTRWCEVDLIAQKDKIVHFIEVKYRVSDAHGSGFDYITPLKLNQLKFAARFWTSKYNWGGDYRINAAEVTGLDYAIIDLVEIE